MNSYKDIHVAFDAMAIEVYDGPSPSWEYVHLLEEAMFKALESLTEVLHDWAHVEKEA